MSDAGLNQRNRLLVLLLDIGILSFVSWEALGQWFPPVGVKGFWFYAAILSLLLGFRLITPFYVKPVDAISYAVPAVVALFLVNDWNAWERDERLLFALAVIYCSLVGIISFISILSKDSNSEVVRRLSNGMRITVATLGVPQAIFSVLIFFAIYTFHRESTSEILWIGLAWVLTVATQPADVIIGLFYKLKNLWKDGHTSQIVGTVMAYQNPGVILIRQTDTQNISFGTSLLIRDPHAPNTIALTLDYVGRDEGIILRAIALKKAVCSDKDGNSLKGLPDNAAIALEKSELKSTSDETVTVIEGLHTLVGIVAPETSVEKLFFEVIKEEGLEEGRLIETFVGNQPVLYQIVNGLTKEEIVHKKNKYGYVRAQAQKIGIWINAEKRFANAKWLPSLNTPVFLKTEKAATPSAVAVGHFPKTDYSVGIKNINELVTHNTAILGILGIGKSMLGVELLERMMAAGIKVICLDLTNQYATELADYYDPVFEKSNINRIQDAVDKDQENCADNPEKGGSAPTFSEAIYNDLKEFLNPKNARMLKIYNPSQFTATKQTTEPRQYKVGSDWHRGAPLWTLTPVEVTNIVSEAALSLLQEEMTDQARACLVYEEAHSLIPEWNTVANDRDRAATNGTARAILQGRKYGLGCLLITQRTANVTKTILNQCNSIFAMRTFDETGKEFLSNYIGKEYASILSSLGEREAVFFGKASTCENPVLIRLNDRNEFKEAFRREHPPKELPQEPAVTSQEEESEELDAYLGEDIPF